MKIAAIGQMKHITFSPIPPYQLFQSVYAHVDWVIPWNADVPLLEIFLIDLIRVPRACIEEQGDHKRWTHACLLLRHGCRFV